MAIYHLSIKIITRGKSKSAIAAAAYRAGERIYSEYENMTHDYSKKGGIVFKEIFLPENAPGEYEHRRKLWNAVENSERYVNAQLAREFEIGLPVDLTREQNISLIRSFATDILAGHGMCADVCMHDTGEGNPHAHIMCTMRPIEKDGKWGQKSNTVNGRKINTVDWNDRDKAEHWRSAWALYCNKALRENGHEVRIDHRSYDRQGIEQIPTIHMGVAATHMERKGITTELGDKNREIALTNQEIRNLNARMKRLEKWIAEEKTSDRTPSLYDVLDSILSNDKYHVLTRVKNAAAVLAFLQRNKIEDVDGLENKVVEMRENLGTVKTELGKIDRRIGTLQTHLAHSENYKECRKYKRHYEKLKSEYEDAKKATSFSAKSKVKKALEAMNGYAEYRRDKLELFDEADAYLRRILQSRYYPKKLPPIKKWQNELVEKTDARKVLQYKFDTLRDETKRVEQIKRSLESLLSGGDGESETVVVKNNRDKNAIRGKKSIIETLDDFEQNKEKYQQHVPEQKPAKSYDIDR